MSAIKHTGNFSEFFTQTAAIFLGCVAAVILSTLDYGDYAKFWPVYSILALGLVGLTFIIGIAPEGTDNKAWLLLPGGISLQPAELLKISFIIGFSKHVTGIREEGISPLNVLLLCLHGGAHILLVHLQGDDGTALVFLVMFLAMMLAAGIKARYFIIAGVSAVIAAPIVWFQVLQQYQKDRILLLFSNEIDLQGNGWQQWRGRLAISSGGITGHGLFRGPQVQSGDLPAAKNDFIFAVAGEELGFMGCIAIILLMLFICVRALRVARLSRDKTGMIIC
ncbi:MAG TPA: rod shape-determining protein RodA, partial [Ruminococcaceae bacterium]|nr:rod shape-determining protein RodA [Oscillospiraceae bacterium]